VYRALQLLALLSGRPMMRRHTSSQAVALAPDMCRTRPTPSDRVLDVLHDLYGRVGLPARGWNDRFVRHL
jgi:hypothetical protein